MARMAFAGAAAAYFAFMARMTFAGAAAAFFAFMARIAFAGAAAAFFAFMARMAFAFVATAFFAFMARMAFAGAAAAFMAFIAARMAFAILKSREEVLEYATCCGLSAEASSNGYGLSAPFFFLSLFQTSKWAYTGNR